MSLTVTMSERVPIILNDQTSLISLMRRYEYFDKVEH